MEFSSKIQSLLKILPPEIIIRNFLVDYLDKKYQIKIPRNCIELKKNSLVLIISPTIKMKLQSQYLEIIKDCNQFLKEKNSQLIIKNIF